MLILAVESSCDETAVALVRDGREVLTDCISSQVELHRIYGGVVPEIASRKHIECTSLNFMAAITICSDFGAQNIKSATVSTVSPSICHEVMGPDAMILVF